MSTVEDLFLMSNLSPKQTGLPFVVWVSPKGGAQHDVRVKVSPSPKTLPEEFTTVAVRPVVSIVQGEQLAGKDFQLLKQWIELNQDVLIRFWNGDIEYTSEMLEQLKPLE